MAPVLRAWFFYFFLVYLMRIAGRRPGKQLTPFEFVLIFFVGGLALTAMIGNEASFTNAILEIMAIAMAHALLTVARAASPRVARWVDGTPLVLLENHQWRKETMIKKRIQDDDVMAMARDQQVRTLDEIEMAVLERNGDISVLPEQKQS